MDYSKGAGVAAPAAILPATGSPVELLWLLIAAVALIGLGFCISRFMPRRLK
jgi:hypothetical protein